MTIFESVPFARISLFPPEHFSALANTNISRYRQFRKRLRQMGKEEPEQVLHAEEYFQFLEMAE
jgi:peptide subunit release factor RF-3